MSYFGISDGVCSQPHYGKVSLPDDPVQLVEANLRGAWLVIVRHDPEIMGNCGRRGRRGRGGGEEGGGEGGGGRGGRGMRTCKWCARA